MTNERRTQKKHKTKTQKTQQLGRMAQLSIRHNDEEAEAFLSDLEAGRPTRLALGQVVGVFGGGSFMVKVGPMQFRAHLRGIIKGRGSFHRNPAATTAVRLHSYVVVDGEEIWASLTTGQAYRARKALGLMSSGSNAMFNRSSERRLNTILRKGLHTRKNSRSHTRHT